MNISRTVYAFKRGIVNSTCFCIDSFLLMLTGKAPKAAVGKKTVLVMRLDAIGDFIIWTDSARAYRKLYPESEYKLILLGNVAWLSLAHELGIFDEVWGINRKKLLLDPMYRIKMILSLFKENFDSVIYHTYSREFSSGDLLIRILNAKNKIGIVSDSAIDTSFWTNAGSKWYTQLYDIPLHHSHELHKNAGFIRAQGLKDFEPSLPVIKSGVQEQIVINARYFVVFPGARVGLRQWGAQNYAELAKKMYEATGWIGIVCGSEIERELAEHIIKTSGVPMLNMAGKTSLKQLVWLISRAELLVGNETSGVHIAVAVQTPSVCVLGGGHFNRFVPYPDNVKLLDGYETLQKLILPRIVYHHMPCFHCDWNCIYKVSKHKAVPCIEKITVEQTWNVVLKLVEEVKNEM